MRCNHYGSRTRVKRAGFSLIELLIVITIIAVLTAILFPLFQQDREKARQTTCLSNLKQMGAAQLLYLQDYDETFEDLELGAALGGNPAVKANDKIWEAALVPYVGSTAVFACPDGDPNNLPFDSSFSTGISKQSIGINLYLCSWYNYHYWVTLGGQEFVWSAPGPISLPGYPRPTTLALAQYASLSPLFMDSFDLHTPTFNSSFCGGDTPYGYYVDPGCGFGVSQGLSDRHSGGVNICFIDGHARWFSTPSVLNQMSQTDPSWNYMAETNYNLAGLVWDLDAPNMYTSPNLYPTFCCTDTP